jgi:hypothetical protein
MGWTAKESGKVVFVSETSTPSKSYIPLLAAKYFHELK